MFEVHDKVLAPRPTGRKVIMLEEAEVVEVDANWLVIKFPDRRKYSKITISPLDVVKVAE